MTYQDFFTTIIGRQLDLDNKHDKMVATSLAIYFLDRDDSVLFNGVCAINLNFYKNLNNNKERLFCTTDYRKASYLQKIFSERKYSQDQKEKLAGYMSVARKVSGRKEEAIIITEMKEFYQGSYGIKPDEINSTLIVDAVRINRTFDTIFCATKTK